MNLHCTHVRSASARSCHVAARTLLRVTSPAILRTQISRGEARSSHRVLAAPGDREEQLSSTVSALLEAQKLLLQQNQALIAQQGKLIDKICAISPETTVSAAPKPTVASAPPTLSPNTPVQTASPRLSPPSPPSPSPSTPPKPPAREVTDRGPGEKEERWVSGMPRSQVSAWEEAKAQADELAEIRSNWIRQQMQEADRRQQAEQREKE